MIYILHYLKASKLMGIMVHSLLWVMHDLYRQPYYPKKLIKVYSFSS